MIERLSDPQTVSLDESNLRRTVEQVLTDALGRPVRVAVLKREPSPFATVFPAKVLSVSLQGGEAMQLFVKYLGSEQADHPEKQRRDREVRIYEALLQDDGLPVIRYYGSRWNKTTRRREVFLEHVNDWNLKYQDIEHWFTAARRLAQLHAHFAAQAKRLRACDFLLRFDVVYFQQWAHRALAVVAERSAELGARLRQIVRHYDRVAETLTRQPATLVHNDLSPKNVIADRSCNPARICFVDWEMAGVGCGLLDLVHLKYGLDPLNDQKMRETYYEGLAGTGLLPASPEALSSLLAACELHKTLYRLWRSSVWQKPIDAVAQWVAEAQQWFSCVRVER